MAGRVVFFAHRGSFEPAFQLASMAVTAAAMGDEVHIVFSFDALRELVSGTFGYASTTREVKEQERGRGMDMLEPAKLLGEARTLGARFWACDTTVRLCGLNEHDCQAVLDEVAGLASIWRLTEGARVLAF